MSAQLDEIGTRLRKAIEIGAIVVLSKDREGIVRYKGPLEGKSGIFYGLELTKGSGKHNGLWRGKIRYFTSKKNKGIFVDKKQILYKRNDMMKKRASLNSLLPDIFHCEYLHKRYGIWSEKKGIDPINIALQNNWNNKAKQASTWKQKWQLLKDLMHIICNDEYGKFDLPSRFIYNENHLQILIHLITWLKNEKHLGSRKHILKILIPYCKTYKLNNTNANSLAKNLIQQQWKETKYGFRGLATKTLLAIYYGSDCILADWKSYIHRCLESKSDVRVQVWNLLSQICILAAKTNNTFIKQKALLDIEIVLNDKKIIDLAKHTMNSNNKRHRREHSDKIMYACAEFIFGAKYILPDMKIINSVYNKVKEDRFIMKDAGINEYCQLLVTGDNAFDLYNGGVGVINRRKLWNERKIKIKCDFCCGENMKLKDVSNKVDIVMDEIEDLKDIVNELRGDNIEYEEDIMELRSEVLATDKKTELLNDDLKDIEMEIFSLKRQIYELKKREKRKMKMMNNKKVIVNKLDLLNWDKWNCDDIIQWILSLEHGKYLKYKNELYNVLPMENVRGDELHLINEQDLIHFGVNNESDRKDLIEHIKLLRNNEYQNKIMNELSPPPMAFNNVDLSIPYIGHVGQYNNNMNGAHLQQEGIVIINDR
eukprot:506964_1